MTQSRALLLGLLLAPSGLFAETGPIPWEKGDPVVGGWKIASVEPGREALSLGLALARERTAVEIVASRDDERLPYRTEHYTVQPMLGSNPPAALLKTLRDRLLDWEKMRGHVPFVLPEESSSRENRQESWFLLANAAALILFLFVLWDWTRIEPKWRNPTGAALGAAAAIAAVCFFFLSPEGVSTDWVTVLHGGRTEANLHHLYGRGVHAGPNFAFISKLWTWEHSLRLKDVVRMNLALAGVNAAFFLALGWRVLGKFQPALLLTLFFALNRCTLNATVSELPSQLITLYLFMGIVAGAVFHERSGRSPAALALLALLSALVFMTRPEAAGVGIVALLVAGLILYTPATQRGKDCVASRLKPIMKWKPWKKAALIAAIALFSLDIWFLPHKAGWLIEGLRPANPSFLLMPVVLQQFLPVGMVLLILLGIVHSFRKPAKFLGLPIALLVLFRIYHAAANGSFNHMFRFMSLFAPMAFFLALFGWKEVETFIKKKRARRIALGVLAALFLIPPTGAAYRFYRSGLSNDPARESRLLDGNNQLEIRYLLNAMESRPDCIFVSKTAGTEHHTGRFERTRWAFFGAPLSAVRFVENSASLQRTLRGQFWLPACVFFYRGLYCDLLGTDRCAAETQGKEPIDPVRFANRNPASLSEYGRFDEAIRLGLYEVRR